MKVLGIDLGGTSAKIGVVEEKVRFWSVFRFLLVRMAVIVGFYMTSRERQENYLKNMGLVASESVHRD